MIPKIIHYCWFGGKVYPEKIQRCIDSWKRELTGYEFVLWNEDRFDIESVEFVKNAYANKKYAFVSDYVRVYALQKYGGIYLDTDIEVIKPFDHVLNNSIVLGTDDGGFLTAFMASEKGQDLWAKVLSYYDANEHPLGHRDNDLVNNRIIQRYLKEYGYETKNIYQALKSNIVVYPDEYFHAKSLVTGKFHVTNETMCVHHHTTLWVSKKTKIIKFLRIKILMPIIGNENYHRLIRKISKLNNINNDNSQSPDL